MTHPGYTSRMALLAVLVDGPRRPVDIQPHLGITSGGITKLVDHLEHDQLVARNSVRTDRRGVEVAITRRGRAALTRTVQRLDIGAVWTAATQLAAVDGAAAVLAIHQLQVLLDKAAGP